MSFSTFLTTSNIWLVHSTAEYQNDIDIYYSPWQNLHPISISFWYSDVLYTSQVLDVARNGKNSIFLPILLNLNPNKSLVSQYYPKSVPNPDILIIWLPKNNKIVVLAKILFWLFFLSKQCTLVTLKCIGRAEIRPRIFFQLDCHHMFMFLFCNLHEVSYKIWKDKPISKGALMHVVLLLNDM